MTIKLYNNSSPKKTIGKSLTLIDTLTGSLRAECDMLNPSIVIEHSGVINANYAKIEEFNRYYFIRTITSVRQDLWRIEMHEDVRESWASSIKTNRAIIERASGYYNLYLKDGMLPLEQDTFTTTYALGNEISRCGVFLLASDSSSTS